MGIPLDAAINKEAVATYKEREAKRQKLKDEQVGFWQRDKCWGFVAQKDG